MKILLAHNFYQQPGGEDQVFRSELALLESYGHKPVRFEMHNDDVRGMASLALLGATVWRRTAAGQLREAIRAHKIDVVHFHNTFPLMSPSVYYAAHSEGAAVVQTLHNFRLLCPSANFYRDGKVCEKCLGKAIPLPGVIHKCYRNSRSATAAVATMLTIHRAAGTWKDAVDAYITPTPSAKAKFIEGGLPGHKIIIKPHFVDPDPGVGAGSGGYAIFVGRLSIEKGVDTLLAAWDAIGQALPLKIIGDGPLLADVKAAVARNPAIEWLGRRTPSEVYDLIGNATMLVMPSNCFETFGRVAAEAFSKGTPVVASDHGAPADVVDHGRTGLRFIPGDAIDLAAKIHQLLADPAALSRMRTEARHEFEAKYAGAQNYKMLIGTYEQACLARSSRDAAVPANTIKSIRAAGES